jgi:hypothetical protein
MTTRRRANRERHRIKRKRKRESRKAGTVNRHDHLMSQKDRVWSLGWRIEKP